MKFTKMLKNNYVLKKILYATISLTIIVGMLPLTAFTALSSSNDTTSSSIFAADKTKPADFDENDTNNPYTNNTTSQFLMSEENELWLYRTGKSDKDSDNIRVNSRNIFDSVLSSATKSNDSSGNKILKAPDYGNTGNLQYNIATNKGKIYERTGGNMLDKFSFVKAVAFDPGRSGRKDYVAYLGVTENSGGNCELWLVIEKINASASNATRWSYKIANTNWMNNNGGIAQAKANNYIAITAGDYDGDGQDTIVVYACDDSSPKVKEFRYNTDNTGIEINSIDSYHTSFIANTSETDAKYERDRLTCSLATGDFDGDSVDDLAISMGMNKRTSINSSAMSTNELNSFSDLVTIFQYRKIENGSKALLKTEQYSLYSKVDNNNYNVMHSASISSGDVDNDGYDEIVATGFYSNVIWDGATARNLYNWNSEMIALGVINVGSRGGRVNSLGISTLEMNEIMKDTFKLAYEYDEYIKTPLTTQCVTMNGDAAADTVFISGSLYDLSGSAPTLLYSAPSVKEGAVQGGRDYYVENATVGNFYGDYSRQQVVFTLAGKPSDNNRYTYYLCVTGSYTEKDDSDPFGKVSKYQTIYNETDMNSEIDDIQSDSEGMNFIPLSVDANEDGIMSRYSAKDYFYADPQVTGVLQAAPYFGELGSFDDFNNGATSYIISTEYVNGATKSNNVSFGVGITGEANTNLLKVRWKPVIRLIGQKVLKKNGLPVIKQNLLPVPMIP